MRRDDEGKDGGRREDFRESGAGRREAGDFKEPARREDYKESGGRREETTRNREESGKEGGCRREDHKDRVINLIKSSDFQRLLS